jgi:PAS domain S-box-containing protein
MEDLKTEVISRFGLMPNFFSSAFATPGLAESLWVFSCSTYLDLPLPSVFKERLFVHLSRFCPVRYCIVRHCCFLLGYGHSAGDPNAEVENVEDVLDLLNRPLSDALQLEATLHRLENGEPLAEIPNPRSQAESDIFDALTALFIEPGRSERTRNALRHAIGRAHFEYLSRYFSLIRSAHYWMELNPDLELEPDAREMLRRHPELAARLLDSDDAESEQANSSVREALKALREAKQALRASEEYLSLVLESTEDGIEIIDRHWRFVYRNAAGRRMLEQQGHPPDNGIGQILWDVYPNLLGSSLELSLREAMEFRRHLKVNFIFTTSGNEIETRIVPLNDGGLSVYFQDITERNRTQRALSQSEARYRMLVENVTDYAILLLDQVGFIHEWTGGAVDVFQYAPEEIIGRPFSLLISSDAQAAVESQSGLLEATTHGRVERETWRVRKNGERFWANEIITVVRDVEQRLLGFSVVTRDLTERRRALEADERRRLAQERDAMRRRLSLAEEEERRRLSRELHDEAGQHVTALGLGIQALRNSVQVGTEAERHAATLDGLVHTLSSELHALAVRLRPKVLDDFGLEAAMTSYADEWAQRTGIHIDVQAESSSRRLSPSIQNTLYRIFQETLTNIARHSGATRVGILLKRRAEHIQLIVEDDGKGFDIANLDTEKPGGGLGLFGIRERVELFNGSLEIESSPREGTTIFVRLPFEVVENEHHVKD